MRKLVRKVTTTARGLRPRARTEFPAGEQGSVASEQGSAAVVSVGITALAVALVAGVGFVAQCGFVKAHAEGTADLAALAAADVARGKAPGEPCEVAKLMIEREDLKMGECIARPDLGSVKVEVKADMPKPVKDLTVFAVAGAPRTN